jgi:hypothetical protein
VSRKNLSRTVIEGGRYHRNKADRRASHGIERARTREWLDHVARDVDEADAYAPRERPRVHKLFYDKLAPAQRWLVAQVGRPWDKIYAELHAKFDTRTVAGRHVVHDHMLQWVRLPGDVTWRSGRFELVVDVHGILRKPPWFGISYRKRVAELRAWTLGRYCAMTFRGWCWFRKVGVGAPCVQWWKCRNARHPMVDDVRYHAIAFLPVEPLTRGEVTRLEKLPEDLRRLVMIAER